MKLSLCCPVSRQHSVRLGIPPRTQLRVVFRVREGWLVFTDCPNLGAELRDMLGTALLLRNDGTAARITLRGGVGENDSHMEVM